METYTEKRAYKRSNYFAPIALSYFNKEHCFEAQTLNHGAGGMFFKSSFFLQPGATVYIRVKKFHLNGSYSGNCEGLRSVTLADVKWCREIPDANVPSYGIGVKYFEPEY
ncbi:MAG: hypothetical protein JSV31_03025 [Desulfobacterales bacterium]|nr:MAG: hypothetical protein JSV31_03025 [Desulfobacterales bacterium]